MPHSKSQTSSPDTTSALSNPRFEAVSNAVAKTVSMLGLLSESLSGWVENFASDIEGEGCDSISAGYTALRFLVSSRLVSSIKLYGVGTDRSGSLDPESIVCEAMALVDLLGSRLAHLDIQNTVHIKGVKMLALCIARELHSTFNAAWGDHVELRKTAVAN